MKGGYLKEPAKDPINDDVYHYAYKLYAKDANGCLGEGGYYVLGMTKFETDDFATKNPCTFKCSRKDWSQEFAYVVAGGVVASKSK